MRRHFVKRPVFASTQAELTIEDLEDIDSEFTSGILFEGKDEAQHRLEDQGYKVVGGETGIDDIVSLGDAVYSMNVCSTFLVDDEDSIDVNVKVKANFNTHDIEVMD